MVVKSGQKNECMGRSNRTVEFRHQRQVMPSVAGINRTLIEIGSWACDLRVWLTHFEETGGRALQNGLILSTTLTKSARVGINNENNSHRLRILTCLGFVLVSVFPAKCRQNSALFWSTSACGCLVHPMYTASRRIRSSLTEHPEPLWPSIQDSL
jgi:hypothetical protein